MNPAINCRLTLVLPHCHCCWVIVVISSPVRFPSSSTPVDVSCRRLLCMVGVSNQHARVGGGNSPDLYGHCVLIANFLDFKMSDYYFSGEWRLTIKMFHFLLLHSIVKWEKIKLVKLADPQRFGIALEAGSLLSGGVGSIASVTFKHFSRVTLTLG